jgi:mRNA-degrading endonuclease RelE of RelBE toxin-antitoxin system
MSWAYQFDERALKELRKLGTQAQHDIISYLDGRISGREYSRRFGKGHKADLVRLWRYLIPC